MQLSKHRILYIEDHEDTRELVCFVLREREFDVVTCATIETGMRLAVAEAFDLYLLDSWLPDGSGLDLCRKIRQFDQLTPILIYSATSYEADRNLAFESGAQGYLVKPTETTELYSLITSLIDDARRRSEVTAR